MTDKGMLSKVGKDLLQIKMAKFKKPIAKSDKACN